MPWQLVILLQNVFASVYALESRTLANKYKKAHFQILSVVFSFVYAVFLGYAVLNSRAIDMSHGLSYLPLIVLVASAFTVWSVLTFITLRYVDASVGTLLTAMNLLAVVIAAAFLIGENLNAVQLLGASLLFIAVYVVYSIKQSKQKHHNYFMALALSVLASISFGLAITGEKYLLDQMGIPTYAVIGIGAQFLLLLLPALLFRRTEFKNFKNSKFRNKVLVMGLVRGGAGLLFVLAVVGADNVSLIGMLSGFKIILTTILGAILLKELTFIKRKAIASVIACVAVGLMLW